MNRAAAFRYTRAMPRLIPTPSIIKSAGNKPKVIAPNMALRVVDRAIQAHGGAGVSGDFFLAEAYSGLRTLRLADGPDEVHTDQVGRLELKKYD